MFYLVDEGTSEGVLGVEDMLPHDGIPPSDEVPCGVLEQRVLVANLQE